MRSLIALVFAFSLALSGCHRWEPIDTAELSTKQLETLRLEVTDGALLEVTSARVRSDTLYSEARWCPYRSAYGRGPSRPECAPVAVPLEAVERASVRVEAPGRTNTLIVLGGLIWGALLVGLLELFSDGSDRRRPAVRLATGPAGRSSPRPTVAPEQGQARTRSAS